MKNKWSILFILGVLLLSGCSYFDAKPQIEKEVPVIEKEVPVVEKPMEVPPVEWGYPELTLQLDKQIMIMPNAFDFSTTPAGLKVTNQLAVVNDADYYTVSGGSIQLETSDEIQQLCNVYKENVLIDQIEVVEHSVQLLPTEDLLTYEIITLHKALDQKLTGKATYQFRIKREMPTTVSINQNDVQVGDLVRITVEHKNNDESLKLLSPLSGYVIQFSPIGDQYVAYVPIPLTQKLGSVLLTVELYQNDLLTNSFPLTIQVLDKTFGESRIQVSQETKAKKTADTLSDLQVALDTARTDPSQVIYMDGPMIQPVEGRISTEYGLKRFVNDKYESRHNGLDIAAPEGTTIAACQAGEVVWAGMLTATGNTLIIDHGQNIFSIHYHMYAIDVAVGDIVKKGDIVGAVGTTGFSTGPHLHWCIWINGAYVNPWQMISEESDLIIRKGNE